VVEVKKVMVLLFSFAELDKVIDYSFNLLQDEDDLEVVAIVGEEVSSSLSDLITDVGFLGDKVTEDVENAVVNEYQERADKSLERITDEAEADNHNLGVEKLTKISLEELKEKLDYDQVDHLVINYTEDQFLSNEVLDYDFDEFLANLDMPYEVYFDGELSKTNN
jgi:bacterioferritin